MAKSVIIFQNSGPQIKVDIPGDFESDKDEDDTDKDILFLSVKKFDS